MCSTAVMPKFVLDATANQSAGGNEGLLGMEREQGSLSCCMHFHGAGAVAPLLPWTSSSEVCSRLQKLLKTAGLVTLIGQPQISWPGTAPIVHLRAASIVLVPLKGGQVLKLAHVTEQVHA